MKNKYSSNSSTQIEEEEKRQKQLYTKNRDKRELCFHTSFLFHIQKQECHSTI